MGQLQQRPHYFVRHLLANGIGSAVWVDPYPARLPRWSDLARFGPIARSEPLWLERPHGLTVLSPGGLPIDPLPGGVWLNRRCYWRRLMAELAREGGSATVIGLGRPSALGLEALRTLPHQWSFYDAMDMFPEFYTGLSRRFIRGVEEEVGRRVTRIYASSTALAERCRRFGRPVTLMRNAYDMSLLPPIDSPPTAPQRGLGFLGCMGHWFDWPLAIRVADAVRPDPVVLVGPRPVPGPARLPSNMTWERERHQSDTVPFLSSLGAGLIPFKRNNLTAGVDPIKYYQYRGAGLPVLTTAFGEMTNRADADDTFFLDGPRTLDDAIASALERRPAACAVARFRHENTWTARFIEARVLCPQ